MPLGLIGHNAEFKALYQHLRTRSRNPLAGTPALVALMGKATNTVLPGKKPREIRREQGFDSGWDRIQTSGLDLANRQEHRTLRGGSRTSP